MNPHRQNYTPAPAKVGGKHALRMLGNTVMTLLCVAIVVFTVLLALGAL